MFFGSLGRLLRDIYVNIIYLKTTDYTEKEMELCWEYQTVSQQINLIQFESDPSIVAIKRTKELKRESLLAQMNHLNSRTLKDIKDGKNEKLVSYERLAQIKGFNISIFKNEFNFFSQFSHSTAFANSFVKSGGLDFGIIALVFDKIVAYHVGIVTESLDVLLKDHADLDGLKKRHDEIIKKRWN